MKAVRLCSGVLFVTFVAVYIAAKIDFFTRYSPVDTGSYLRRHSIYWAIAAVIALLAWLLERLFPQRSS